MNGGPLNVNVELLSPNGDVVTSALTSHEGNYLFSNIIPGLKIFFFKKNLISLKLVIVHFLQMLVEFTNYRLDLFPTCSEKRIGTDYTG